MRRVFVLLVGGSLLAGILALAGPANAVPQCKAGPTHGDGKIRRDSDPYLGKDIFNCDADNQSVSLVAGPSDKVTFDVKYKNDSGATVDDVRVAGTLQDQFEDFKVKAVRPDKGNKNVTDKFLGDGVGYKNVADGASTKRLHLIVKGLETVEIGDD